MADTAVHSVYCEQSDQIVPLDGGNFCRACDTQLDHRDRRHTEVTPEVLGRMGYANTPLPEKKLRGAGQ